MGRSIFTANEGHENDSERKEDSGARGFENDAGTSPNSAQDSPGNGGNKEETQSPGETDRGSDGNIGGLELVVAERFRSHINNYTTLAKRIVARNSKIRHAVINGEWEVLTEEAERMIEEASKVLDKEGSNDNSQRSERQE